MIRAATSFAAPSFAAIALAAALALVPQPAAALADFSFTGSFAADDDVQLFNFTADGVSTVTLITFGYAGGTNAAGSLIAAGGFDPIVALFDSTGALVTQSDDAGATVGTDPVTGAEFDSFISGIFAAGSYTVALMEFDNFALGPNLSDGFGRGSSGNFTTGFNCTDAQGAFNDVTGAAGCGRTGNWALDIRNAVSAASVVATPEPASFALLGIGLVGLASRRRG